MSQKTCSLLVLLVLAHVLVACAGTATPAPTAAISATSVAAPDLAVGPVLQPFLEPEAGYAPILMALDTAKTSIRIETYLLTSSDVIDFVKSASRKGVDVRVIFESQPAGAGTGNGPAVKELQAANVRVKSGNPAFKRTHSSFIVIDDSTVIIMTLDQTRDGFTLNREFGIIDSDPRDVADAIAVFDADWDRQASTARPDSNLIIGPADSRARLLAVIDQALMTLDVETEDMQDAEIQAHLIAAVQRGVAVRVIMSPALSGTDLNAQGRADLIAGGVKVRLTRKPYIHAHMLVADNARGFIGSQNFTPLSLDASRELGILTTNARIIDGLAGTFLVDWNLAK